LERLDLQERLEPSGEQQGVPVGAAILDVRWAAD
jgi:hypothetical protein